MIVLQFILCAASLLPVQTLIAAEQDDTSRERLKTQIEYGRWADLLRARPAVQFEKFTLEKGPLGPWQIRRTQEIGKANRGTLTQYVLSKSDQRRDDDEVIRISITRCASRNEAIEGLVDHLTGIQRPDLKLTESEALRLGDLTVQTPGEPAASVYFVRGNIIVTVENAGKKLTPDIRELARRVDQDLARKSR